METIRQKFTVPFEYPVVFTRGAFSPSNTSIERCLSALNIPDPETKVLALVDSNLLAARPTLADEIVSHGGRLGTLMRLVAPPVAVPGGEACKSSDHPCRKILGLIERHRLTRHSFVLTVGGGAVLDTAGYAAAIAHRGIRLIRMPSTVLSQNDAGIGVKNGINCFGRKNFLGTFAPPFAVINDYDLLASLPEREKRAGISEAMKIALIKDRTFFEDLYRERNALSRLDPPVIERMIFRCAQLHLRHIGEGGDPFEFGSSRPLDYGHWLGHALEERTCGSVRHGEAVAVGIAVDSTYSWLSGHLGEDDLNRILSLIQTVGLPVHHRALDEIDFEAALNRFQEHLGGPLTIVLLRSPGAPFDAHRMETGRVAASVQHLKRVQWTRHEVRPKHHAIEAGPGHLLS